jgi:hypothetical protein
MMWARWPDAVRLLGGPIAAGVLVGVDELVAVGVAVGEEIGVDVIVLVTVGVVEDDVVGVAVLVGEPVAFGVDVLVTVAVGEPPTAATCPVKVPQSLLFDASPMNSDVTQTVPEFTGSIAAPE